MSRIHEALKRAEQERAASQGSPLDWELGPERAPLPTLSPTMVGVALGPGSSPAPLNPGPSFANAYTFDTLMARCGKPRWNPDTKTMLFFNADENTLGTEEFRTLRSRLYEMREKMQLKKVLLTSALPGEGKSFVAANLAQVIARQCNRVLLIDADLRGPRLHTALGTHAIPGLTEYLAGASDEFSIIQQGAMENLFFIPGGRNVSRPAELVANGRLKILLQRAEPLFDWIIVDSPPAVPNSDARVLADFCDGVLMVVRSNATPLEVARRAGQEFQGRTLIGVVLNGVNVDSSYNGPFEKSEPQSSQSRNHASTEQL